MESLMSPNFITTNRDQQYLFPPSVQDWLPEDHLARFVVDIVSQLNIRPLTEAYDGRGSKAYHPEILLSLLFYFCDWILFNLVQKHTDYINNIINSKSNIFYI